MNFTGSCPSAANCMLNHIPVGRIDPNAVKLLNLYPAALRQGIVNNQTSDPNLSETRDGFDTRIDYAANDKNQIFGRFSYVNDPQYIPVPSEESPTAEPSNKGIRPPCRSKALWAGPTSLRRPR